MKIQWTRISNERHRLTVERPDGTRIEREFETRSVLLHDLVHYALETEAGLDAGFWGLLAAGADFDELLAEAEVPTQIGILLVESLVGPFQAVWHGRLDPHKYVALAQKTAPFVDRAFVERVRERLRRLWGHWQATRFHQSMELTWPAPKARELPLTEINGRS